MSNALQVPAPPPLIRARRVPTWLLVRDLVLTAIAWLAILQSMRDGLYLLYDFVTPPRFEFTHARLPHWIEMWHPLSWFVLLAIWTIIWLVFWSFHGTRQFRTKPAVPQPAALTTSQHAALMGVKEEDLARWKSYRIAVVTFDSSKQITSVSRRDLESRLSAVSG